MTASDGLSERELDIMEGLWARGVATVAEIQEDLEAFGIEIAYTTVQTLLTRMVAKGLVKRDASDRAHQFRPRLKRDLVLKKAVQRLAQRFFHGSTAGLAVSLIEDGLAAEDVERLRRSIDKYRAEHS